MPRKLSPRQTEVIEAVSRGLSNAEIALALNIQITTVEYHLGNVFRVMGVQDRTAAALAFQIGAWRGGQPCATRYQSASV